MSSADLRLHRSYLYAPGSDARLVGKALEAGADAVVLDLEDAVVAAAQEAARTTVADLVRARATTAAPDVHVRVDRTPDGHYDPGDLDAAVQPGLDALRLPKAEDPQAIADVADRLDHLEARRGLPSGSVGLYPTIESARGIVALTELLTASDRVVRLAFGTSDLLADLGASGDDELTLGSIRVQLVVLSRAHRRGPPIDSVHTDLTDDDGLRAAADRARARGFVGKSVIHPRQLDAVHAAFTPTAAERADAEAVIAAHDREVAAGRGAFQQNGRFVDAAVVARARALLALRGDRS